MWDSPCVWLDGGLNERSFLVTDPIDIVEGGFNELERALKRKNVRLFGFIEYEVAALIEELPFKPGKLWFLVADRWTESIGDLRIPKRIKSGTVCVDPDNATYQKNVSCVIERIYAGDLFQTNLCRRFTAPCDLDSAFDLYLRMRERTNPNYGAYIRGDGFAIASASPECFLSVRGELVKSYPIKGSCKPGLNLNSEKDLAELSMIVDLMRNDLGCVCKAGSIKVGDRQLLKMPNIWHSYQEVTGRLKKGTTPVELLQATFPPGSVTGAPKIEAIKLAAKLENKRRSVSMGAIGWIDASFDLELSVAIRTAKIEDGRAVYHAGAGIVSDSDPLKECLESRLKADLFCDACTF